MKQSHLRVLVVHDYADNRAIHRFMLERQGVTVLEASNGQEAIEVAEQENPDVILMDLDMPILDGIESTRQLKQHPETEHISIFALSAHYQDFDFKSKAFGVGCIDCLEQPLNLDKVKELVSLIDHEKSQLEARGKISAAA